MPFNDSGSNAEKYLLVGENQLHGRALMGIDGGGQRLF
jgi:hypothetical protein